MTEYIEREAAIKLLHYNADESCSSVVADFEALPAEDVAPVAHGQWKYNTDDFTPAKRCSICGYNKPVIAGEGIKQEPENYCPSCGAKMEEAQP